MYKERERDLRSLKTTQLLLQLLLLILLTPWHHHLFSLTFAYHSSVRASVPQTSSVLKPSAQQN